MGYYVKTDGIIKVKNADSSFEAKVRDWNDEDFIYETLEFKREKDITIIFITDTGKYHEPYKFLNRISNNYEVIEGDIDYVGEDGELWRHIYKDGNWYEQEGYVAYNTEKEWAIPKDEEE